MKTMRFIIVCSTRQWRDDILWLIANSLADEDCATVFCVSLRQEVLTNNLISKFRSCSLRLIDIDASASYSMFEPKSLMARVGYTMNTIKLLNGILPAGRVDMFLTDNAGRTADLVVRSLCDITQTVLFKHGIRSVGGQRLRLLALGLLKNVLVFSLAMLASRTKRRLLRRSSVIRFADHGDYNIKLSKIAAEPVVFPDAKAHLILTSGNRRYVADQAEKQLVAEIIAELKANRSDEIYLKTKPDEPELTRNETVKVLPPARPLTDLVREIRPKVVYCHCSSTAVLETLLMGIEVQVYGLSEQASARVFSQYTDEIRQFLNEDAQLFHEPGLAGTVKLVPTEQLKTLIKDNFNVTNLERISLDRFFNNVFN